MDRIVEVRVNGGHVTKDSQYAGTQGEANVTSLRVEFDESWDGCAKTITWWDARGENPTARVLTADALEDIKASTRIYLTPVVPEALAIWGQCMFAIDGYINGKRAKSAYARMVVRPRGNGEDVTIEDVTPTVAEQLQVQIEALLEQIQNVLNPGGGNGSVVALSRVSSITEAGDDVVVKLESGVSETFTKKYDGSGNLTGVADSTGFITAVSSPYLMSLAMWPKLTGAGGESDGGGSSDSGANDGSGSGSGSGAPMFIYNDEELPALPEWDKSVYPYALIWGGGNRKTLVCMTTAQDTVELVTLLGITQPQISFDGVPVCVWQLIDGRWRPAATDITDYDTITHPVWANYELYNEDGSVYLSATDPIPVSGGSVGAYPEAYWYNDIEMSPLPDVDRSAYPYMWFGVYDYLDGLPFHLYLYCSAKPMNVHDTVDGVKWVGDEGETAICYKCSYYDHSRTWERHEAADRVLEMTDWSDRPFAGIMALPHWSEYDIYTPDGELLLSASEPVRSTGNILER